jgi:multidrug efflux pump subunit AcrB
MRNAELAIERICALGGVSRRGFYRFDPDANRAERDIDLRDAIQRIAPEMPSYGRPISQQTSRPRRARGLTLAVAHTRRSTSSHVGRDVQVQVKEVVGGVPTLYLRETLQGRRRGL